MIEAFVGIVMICQTMSPTQCQVLNGGAMPSEDACLYDMVINGFPSIEEAFPDTYIAGAACLSVTLQDEPA